MPTAPPVEPHNPDLCGSSKRHPARTPARSTSSRPLFSHLRVLRVLRGLFFSVSSVVCFSPCPPCRVRCGAGFIACGRLSSRPGHPLPSASLATDRSCGPCSTPLSLPHRHFLWSKPPGLPCRRSRRQSDTISSCTGVPSANRRQDWRRGPHDCALHLQPPRRVGADLRVRPFSSHLRVLRGLFFSVFSVFSVVCLLRVLCGLFFLCPPTPNHNDPQNFFPPLFNHLAITPFLSSCSGLVC